MGLRVTDEAVEFVSGCAVPGCEREVGTSVARKAIADRIEKADGAEKIVLRMVTRVLEESEGDELPLPDVLELPAMICAEHGAVLELLRDTIDRMAVDFHSGPPLEGATAGDPRDGYAATFEIDPDDQEEADGE